ncbi:MAG: hypothetical protein PW789_11595 [Edaphobacter sp.]|uniref:hypothetical protein n=1 Tax=Edaphobacter sp. TaxID=1934404 RepID=UPI002389BF3C|nr:hypothetical protein [Edaphobacter sp.]MDE1177229.1 hypothetical protein [Edaphobacter sp.]
MRRTMAVGFLALMTTLAGAQATASDAPQEVIANGGLIHTLMAAPVVGQPYSAMQVRRIKRVLADGTRISHHGHHSVARDSAGRVRVERRMEEAQNGQPETVMVFVLDPVAHTMMIWTTGPRTTKVATLIRLPEKKEAAKPAAEKQQAAEDSRPQPVVTTEDLAPDTLQGLPVTVRKVTTVVPIGRSGNDAPITKIHETWTSPDLKLVMKEQWEDPRSGEQTVELDPFSRAEPDPALFRAPAGYSVKDVRQTLKELQERLDQMSN